MTAIPETPMPASPEHCAVCGVKLEKKGRIRKPFKDGKFLCARCTVLAVRGLKSSLGTNVLSVMYNMTSADIAERFRNGEIKPLTAEQIQNIDKWRQTFTAGKIVAFGIVGLIFVAVIVVGINNDRATNHNSSSTYSQLANGAEQDSDSKDSIEGTKRAIVDCDWVYPNTSDATAAWKFLDDGTFNFSTTTFGGMSAWGNWSVTAPGKVRVEYTRSSAGTLPSPQILKLSSSRTLLAGSTEYRKY